MRPLDIPEVLIVIGLLGLLGFAVHQWTNHRSDAGGHR